MIILMDKFQKYMLFDVVVCVWWLSRERGVKKVGYCGTFDFMVIGLLILCVGKVMKSVEEYLGMDKMYIGIIKLGEGMLLQDVDEEVNEREFWEYVTDVELREGARKFIGVIKQLLLMYLVIKVNGKCLYKFVREGVEVECKY